MHPGAAPDDADPHGLPRGADGDDRQAGRGRALRRARRLLGGGRVVDGRRRVAGGEQHDRDVVLVRSAAAGRRGLVESPPDPAVVAPAAVEVEAPPLVPAPPAEPVARHFLLDFLL